MLGIITDNPPLPLYYFEPELENEDELKYFLENPDDVIWEHVPECLPNFSYGKDNLPTAINGQVCAAKFEDKYYSFDIYEGKCLQSTEDRTIIRTTCKNICLIDPEQVPYINLIKYNHNEHR